MIDTYTKFHSLRLKWLFTFLNCRESHEKGASGQFPLGTGLKTLGVLMS